MHPINAQRPCDHCLFMADTFHPDMCLHPGRRDPGALGDAIDRALLWNGACPVQQRGQPVFDTLLALHCPVEEWEAAGEYMRVRIARHLALHQRITMEDIQRYSTEYQHTRTVIARQAS